jgi:hypothetical protein
VNELLNLLSSEPVQDFLINHEHDDMRSIMLQHREILGVPSIYIGHQLAGRKKAKDKLPAWYKTHGVVYPPGINVEQCSSELTARYKVEVLANHLSKTELLVDLTGGFGIDSFAFAEKFTRVVHNEPDAELSNIAHHNHDRLSARNIEYVVGTAENYLISERTLPDVYYLDPSRRNELNRKVFLLNDTVPDITVLIPRLYERAEYVLIKTSPLLDLQEVIRVIPSVISLHIVAVNNECKELLILCQRGFTGETTVEGTNFSRNTERFTFTLSSERDTSVGFSAGLKYLYEPNAAILKAGAFKSIAKEFGLFKLHVNTHLYTSQHFDDKFPGRIFEIETTVKSDAKEAAKILPSRKANILTRNYPISPEALRKKLKFSDGGEDYIIGTTALTHKVLYVARRLR